MLRDQFVEGVTSMDLRRELRRFTRANSEASFISVRAEAQRYMSEDVAADEPTIQHVTATQTPELRAIQQQLAALSRQMAEMQRGKRDDPKQGPRDHHTSGSRIVCFGCKERGHKRVDCPKNKASQGASVTGTNNTGSGNC
jgi:hypothetical protein